MQPAVHIIGQTKIVAVLARGTTIWEFKSLLTVWYVEVKNQLSTALWGVSMCNVYNFITWKDTNMNI